MRIWISPTREFVFGYLPDQVSAKLMPGQSIQVGQYQGWLSHQDGLATVIIPMSRYTLVFSGNVGGSQAEVLADQCLQHLEHLT